MARQKRDTSDGLPRLAPQRTVVLGARASGPTPRPTRGGLTAKRAAALPEASGFTLRTDESRAVVVTPAPIGTMEARAGRIQAGASPR